MQGNQRLRSSLDLRDPVQVETLPRLSLNHTLQHPVHIAHGRCEYIDPGCLNVPLRLFRRRQTFRQIGSRVVNLRTSSNIADFALNQDGRIDGFQLLDRRLRLTNVLVDWQRRKIKNDCIVTGVSRFDSTIERVRMICVQKNGKVEFFAQASHQSAGLTYSDKFSFAFRNSDNYGNFQSVRRFKDRFQHEEVSDIEVTDGHSVVLSVLQNSAQIEHIFVSSKLWRI